MAMEKKADMMKCYLPVFIAYELVVSPFLKNRYKISIKTFFKGRIVLSKNVSYSWLWAI